jgi:regulator of sirC expression with transglutaminase-like and TPR domain
VKKQGSLSPFVGNTINYYAVSNSMIHKVLFFRTGIPITLSVIYAAIVRRATGVQLDPLGIPGHFLLSTVISDEQSNTEQRIFIDVFDGGSIMTINDVQRLLLSFGVSWSDSFLKPASNIEICSRMIRNVLNCPDFSSSDTSCIYSFLKFLSKKEVEE